MTTKIVSIKRALLSVSDKAGITDLAKALHEHGVEIISTGGTAKAIEAAGIPVIGIAEVTKSPEMLGGRVKTLHPAIHGGILARRWLEDDLQSLADQNIVPIDLVVVNLYPFAATIAKEGVAVADAVENIDIGGPSMLRSSAKNFDSVTVICEPADYSTLLTQLEEQGGTTLDFRMKMSAKAYAHTADYDAMISSWFSDLQAEGEELLHTDSKFPSRISIILNKKADLRYGENPHQEAAVYDDNFSGGQSMVAAEQIQGKALSFNNYTDMEGAWQLASEFAGGKPFCALIKHANPCGAATGETALEAFETALSVDPVSAFGSIVAMNCDVDLDTATAIKGLFAECLIAPGYSDDALALLKKKKNLRIMLSPLRTAARGFDIKRVSGGMLLADYDQGVTPRSEWSVATKRTPGEQEFAAMEFAWRICKHVKSNAIVYTTDNKILGVGAGQMSRVDSATIAAGRFNKDEVDGPIVMASDAFFPFRDGLEMGAAAGATAVIQPGGSKRDDEVIEAANEHGIAMVFTGKRHFRH